MNLLQALFLFDSADLDFGIYRIMNFKHKEIEHFMQRDLIEAVEQKTFELSQESESLLENELETLASEINRDFGEGTIDKQGRVQKHQDTPKMQQYLRKQEELQSVESRRLSAEEVYNHVYEFFSRYFSEGDFLSNRRIGGRPKYAIPYDGAEKLLYWASNDQYYVKTSEHFLNYTFKAGDWRVLFQVTRASVEQNDVQAEKRFFILANGQSLQPDPEKKELQVAFHYRPLTEAEKKQYPAKPTQEAIARRCVAEILRSAHGTDLERKLTEIDNEANRPRLERHLDRYVKRNTMDYFIHKDLKAFLEGELDFYLKAEVLRLDDLERMEPPGVKRVLAQARIMREIGLVLIDFLAQIVEFEKRLFQKRKFVLETNFCLTLDHVINLPAGAKSDEERHELERLRDGLLREIASNDAQRDEWVRLFAINEMKQTGIGRPAYSKSLTVDFLRANDKLVLDTCFFDERFKERLVRGFPDLDAVSDGLLINSENFQALRLVAERFGGQVKCIYIDPPYNTGDSQILYKNNYLHSSWLSLMENRLAAALPLLTADSVLFVAIDDFEMADLCELVDTRFPSLKRAMIVVNHHPQGGKARTLATTHDYMLVCVAAKSDRTLFGRGVKTGLERRPFRRSGTAESNFRRGRPNSFYAILVDPKTRTVTGVESPPEAGAQYPISPTESGQLRIYPLGEGGVERVWRRSYESGLKLAHTGKLECSVDLTVYQLVEERERGSALFSNWVDSRYNAGTFGANLLRDIMGEQNPFPYPKSVYTVEDALFAADLDDDDICLDFFAGSGTTGHAVVNMNREDGSNRRYILVEMGNHFDDVLMPRMKKVIYSKDWKDGKPLSRDTGVSHFFKYLRLESYEDTLNNIVFRERDRTVQETLDGFRDYFLRYMLDYETRGSPCRISVKDFETPFEYKIWTERSGERRQTTVDLVETFNCLLGLRLERFWTEIDEGRAYKAVFGRSPDGNRIVVVWRSTTGMDYTRDRDFIEKTFLKNEDGALTLFVNGLCEVKGSRPIEPEFKRLVET
ncbi:MAG TPA: DNA methyltransferase [Candidatus Bathyarchaeia archaeon]